MDKKAVILLEGEVINGRLSIHAKNTGEADLQLHMIAYYIISLAQTIHEPTKRIISYIRDCVRVFRVQKGKRVSDEEVEHDPPTSDR